SGLRIHICNALPYVSRLKPCILLGLVDFTRTTCPFLFTSTTTSLCSAVVGSLGDGRPVWAPGERPLAACVPFGAGVAANAGATVAANAAAIAQARARINCATGPRTDVRTIRTRPRPES